MILPLSHSFIHSFICPIHRSFLGACFSETRVPTSPGLKEPTVYRAGDRSCSVGSPGVETGTHGT